MIGGRPTAVGLAVAALAVGSSVPPAPGQIPPHDDYRQFETEHFRVIFPSRYESFARRTAAGAEWAYAALEDRFLEPPHGRVALVLVDQTDVAAGSATPIPRNRVVLNLAPHLSSRQLNNYPDWVDLTIAHELVHIFHLDHAEGLWRLPRAVFGRLPLFFPAFYQPQWVIEGLATFYESRLTGAGRTYGTYFEMILAAAARDGAFRHIDAANGLHPRWPAGQTPYAYGAFFFQDQANEHGDSAIARFARKGAGRVPYTLEWAATPVFGSSLSDEWSRWRSDRQADAMARADSIRGARPTPSAVDLSTTGWAVAGPRFGPDGRRLAYSVFEPVSDPATRIVDPTDGAEVHSARRNSVGVTAWAPEGDALYYSQTDFVDRYRVYGDLYRLDLTTGDEVRLTHGARLSDPDLRPGGDALVAVQTGAGTNRLTLLDLSSGEQRPLNAYVDTVHWGRPRWSPDGKRIAVERWTRGRIVDIAVLNPKGEVERIVTQDAAVDVAPAWSPDGRYLLWSSDRDGTYNIHAVEIGPALATDGHGPTAVPSAWQVTNVIGGAFDPEISPDGRWLVYVAYHREGFRVERIHLDPSTWQRAGPAPSSLPPSPWPGGRPDVETDAHRYSPFPSLWPTSWVPLAFHQKGTLGTFVGASTFATDYVGRHAFAGFAGWRFGIDEPEGAMVYLYRGLGDPTFQLGLSQDWSALGVLVEDSLPGTVIRREREARLSARFERPRFRTALAVSPSVSIERFHFDSRTPGLALARSTDTEIEGGIAFGFSTARRFPRSVSAARGFSSLLDLSHARRLRGGEPDAWRVSAELLLRGYRDFELFGYAPHVLAGRLAVGLSSGRRGGTELFLLGGVPGQFDEILPGVELGGGDDYPVRGFFEGVQFGDRVAAASLEYRFPIWLIGRGHGLWPVLLDRLSGSFFIDGGAAWRDTDEIRTLASAGTELSLELGLGYALPYRVRFGLARTLAVPTDDDADWSAYVSGGVAF